MGRLPAAERREQLLDCAAGIFARYGYARATTAQLAKAAGVTEPIIYRHFKSKRDLFVALIARTGRQTLESWERDLADAKTPAERLARLVGDNPMVSPEGRDAYLVFLQAISEVEDDAIREAVADHISSVHTFIRDELERAQQGGAVSDRYTPGVLAWSLISMGLGYGALSALGIEGHGQKDERGIHLSDVLARVLVGRQAEPVRRKPE
ncbi:MAG: TetR/AcrR family transcriptional regulator [Phycisphaeraceae bacterium]|nr:MAG: TetR/AcrR family transcriptional regulator [Phycisphaeraceae bacterium]